MRRCISRRSLRHLGAFVLGGQSLRLVVEGLDLLADLEVLVGDGAVGDPGIDHRHAQGAVTQQRGNRLEAHAAVDGLGSERVAELVWGNVANSSRFGYFGDGAVYARDGESAATFDEQQIRSQPFGSLRQPVVNECLQLRVEWDVPVGVQLADRHAQPVRRTDLDDRVHAEVDELALPQASSGEELDGDAYKWIRVSARGNQQLGRRCVIKKPGQRLIRDGEVSRDKRHASRRVVVTPFDDAFEEVAQDTESVLDRVAMQWTTTYRGSLGKPPFVGLEVMAHQICRSADGRIFGDNECAELAKCFFGVAHRSRTEAESKLLEVALHGRNQAWRMLGELGPGCCAFGQFGWAMPPRQLIADTSMKKNGLGSEEASLERAQCTTSPKGARGFNELGACLVNMLLTNLR